VFTGAVYQKDQKQIQVNLLEQNDHVGGKPVSDLITEWYNWTISARINENQTDDVYFLRINPKPGESNSPLNAKFTGSATVSKNQAIIFPCLDTIMDDGTFPAENTHAKRIKAAKDENDKSNMLECTIDSVDILGGKPKDKIRMSSDEFNLKAVGTPLVLMDFKIPQGTHKAAVDGYFVCIKELPPHENPYIVRIKSQGVNGYAVDIEYKLQVA
jgi:hypothetical protein